MHIIMLLVLAVIKLIAVPPYLEYIKGEEIITAI